MKQPILRHSTLWIENITKLVGALSLAVFSIRQDSSIGSISAWYRGGPGFKSRQGREFFSENK